MKNIHMYSELIISIKNLLVLCTIYRFPFITTKNKLFYKFIKQFHISP